MIRFQTEREFAFPPEAIWPCLSKTDWLNQALGLPEVKYDIEPRPEGGSWVKARAKFPFGEMRWQEWPFEWIEPNFYRVRRVFENGPFAETRAGLELRPQNGNRTRVVSYAEIYPRSALGKFLFQTALGPKINRGMEKAMADTEAFLLGKSRVVFGNLPIQSVNETALRVGLEKLSTGQPPALLQKLEHFLRETPDVETTHIRPFAVASKWNEDQWQVVRLFLHAARSGLLDFRWEILCPNCRSTREAPTASLAQLKQASHCDVCQIKFDVEFDKSVELKFAVNRAVRPGEERTFCLAGPGGKPHVIAQAWLEPGEERTWLVPDAKKSIRLRSPQVKESLPSTAGCISCEPDGFKVTAGASTLKNPNSFPVLVSWQESEWSEDILTAARATNWQEFRDLFAREVISPNEQVTVGSQIILFTDLRGSTAMYHGMGDAAAYALVRNHFAVLMESVATHHGSVVKTIGDAVMAVFSRVDEALAALQQSYRALAAGPLRLKSSLHFGPCLAVNANDKLDFFGTTVNLAARIIECSQGGDLAVSDEFFQHPETARFVADGNYEATPMEIQHRGFPTPQRVWRIKME